MANFYKPLMTEINAPANAGAASNVKKAKAVRAVNTATTPHLLTLYAYDSDYPAGGDSATMSLAGGETVLIKKKTTDKIFAANTAVKLTKISYPAG